MYNSTSDNHQGYRGDALKILEGAGAAVGDTADITTAHGSDTVTQTGIIMPRYEHADDKHIVIKLKSGYNVGISTDTIRSVAASADNTKKAKDTSRAPDDKAVNSRKKRVLLLSTGGTIASRIDYRTGAVTPVLSAEDLLDAVPELGEAAHIDADVIISEYSENVMPEHWLEIAKRIAKVADASGVHKGMPYSGIIIAHGTDTMHYTSAFLSFALAEFPIPIVLVGAQRSSDRASSDAATNMIGAVKFATSDAARAAGGVYIAMHRGSGDDAIACHMGTRVRKNHTSKRGAFQTVGGEPAFIIETNGAHIAAPRDDAAGISDNNIHCKTFDPKKIALDKKVALVKYHPGYDPDLLNHMIDSGYKAIIFEGTGLGHVGRTIYEQVARAAKSGIFLGMTSQCVDGRVGMTVYESGRDLMSMGVVPLGDMIPEVALVKAMWAAGISDTCDEIKKIMLQNVASEVTVPI